VNALLNLEATSVSRRQRTIRHQISCVGVGLHSGHRVAMRLLPAPVDHGIRVRRVDRAGTEAIRLAWDAVCDTTMSTVVGRADGVRVGTVEHLMAALAITEIDNLLIELDGPELPIQDGSAAPFVFLLECAGIEVQDASRRMIEVLRPVVVESSGRWARLEPAEAAAFDTYIEFAHPLIQSQRLEIAFQPQRLKREIAPARTFGFADDVEQLRARGLALGGSLRNAVVVGQDRILNEEGLRFPDEFVRHKTLDAIGDLYLAGAPIIGRYVGHCAGHALHNKLLRALFADRSAWRWVDERPARRAAQAQRAEPATVAALG
jgi:UDP-3-O-[3-hydroxymyristoyl] N-acetylglucosamine deacetylase